MTSVRDVSADLRRHLPVTDEIDIGLRKIWLEFWDDGWVWYWRDILPTGEGSGCCRLLAKKMNLWLEMSYFVLKICET